jgi:hypothetical protein
MLSQRTADGLPAGWLGFGLRQITAGVIFAKMKFVMLAAFDLGNMKGGRFIALLTFHRHGPL